MEKRYKYIDLLNVNYELRDKRVVIWGLSSSALSLFVRLRANNINIIGFTDSFVEESGTEFVGLPVFTFDEMKALENIVIYIATDVLEYKRQILDKAQPLSNAVILTKGKIYGGIEYDTDALVKKIALEKDEIVFVRENLCDDKSKRTFENLLEYRTCNNEKLIYEVYENGHKQYFPVGEIIKPEKEGVFIDAGAYNGRTSVLYANWNPNYSKIYFMEPDLTMYAVATEYVRLKGIKNIVGVNRGAYSCETELSFKNDFASGSSKIDECGTNTIKTISIDEMLSGEKATFIKMDIEGAEMEALKGADKTITKYKPKLAISIYHKEDDLWKIPYYIKQKYPWYKLFIRHYEQTAIETVMYATV